MPNGGILTPMLKIFLANFTEGTARITPDAYWFIAPLLTIELCWAAIYFLLHRDVDYAQLVSKFVTAAFLGWLVLNWQGVTRTLARSFVQAGLKAGGDAISETDMTDPDTLVLYGFSVTAVIFGDTAQGSLFSPKTYATALLMGLVAACVIVIYFLGAVAIFLSLLEFYWGVAATILLLPLAMFPRLAGLADRAISYIFASGIRLFAISFVLSSTLPVLVKTNVTLQPTMATAFSLLCQALALMGLVFFVNKLVGGLLHGAASLIPQDITALGRSVVGSMTTLGSSITTLTHTVQNMTGMSGGGQNQGTRRRI